MGGGVKIKKMARWKDKSSLIDGGEQQGGNFEYSKENLVHKICYHKFTTSDGETGFI